MVAPRRSLLLERMMNDCRANGMCAEFESSEKVECRQYLSETCFTTAGLSLRYTHTTFLNSLVVIRGITTRAALSPLNDKVAML